MNDSESLSDTFLIHIAQNFRLQRFKEGMITPGPLRSLLRSLLARLSVKIDDSVQLWDFTFLEGKAIFTI